MTARYVPSVCYLNHCGADYLVAELVAFLEYKRYRSRLHVLRIDGADAVMYIGVKCLSDCAV